MAKFKVLAGQHIDKDAAGNRRVSVKDDIIDSEMNLVARLGAGKFQLQPDSARLFNKAASEAAEAAGPPLPKAASTKPPVNLDAMTPHQLQAHADESEIDLKGATKKEDMLRIIKAARPS